MKVKLLSPAVLSKKYPNYKNAEVLLPTDKTIWLPSDCLPLNWQLGGGIPYGKIVELFGYESTGKSLLAFNFCKNAQALGGVVLWGDAEHAFAPAWAEANGLNLERTEVYEGNDVEGLSDWSRDMILYHRTKLVNNEPIVLVWDSLAALETLANIDSDDLEAKAQMGNRAKAIYQMYRKRQHFFHKMGVVVIMINQVRKKLGATMFESNETNPGGESTKFYASIRIALNAGKQIKGRITRNGFVEKADGKKMGRTVYVQIAKNKVAPPKSNIKTQVYFIPDIWGYIGYSKYHGLPEILLEEEVIRKKGSFYYYKDHKICQGEDNLLKLIHEDAKKRKILIAKAPINTVSKTRERIAAIGKNLYPVKVKKTEEEEADE